jgi:hypothetical protein
MSMKPGQTILPRASMTRLALAADKSSIASILSPRTPTSP